MAENFLRTNETSDQFFRRCTNISYFDCSEEEMLWWMMGPRRLPLHEILPISLALLVVFLTGVAGNVAVCVVIVRHPAMRTTTTNYYLFSLALSDLLLLLFGLPNDLSVYWHQYPYSLGIVFCKLRALISEAASYVSVLTIVAFSLERYLAICHPLHLYAMAGLRRALRIVAALWVVSLLAASPFAVYTTVSYHDYPPGSGNASLESAFCAMLELPSWYLCELSSLLFFILPGLVILGLYIRMGLRIRYVMGSTHAHKPGSPGTLNGVNGSVHGEARQAQSRKTIIRMLAAVVIAFFMCWAPFHFQRLFFIYGLSSPHYHTINQYLFSIAGLLYYVSATVNPILYNIMSHRYRIAFKETLCCRRIRHKKRKYRDQSSVRETMVNHTSDGHMVRVRSDRRSRIDRQMFRRGGCEAVRERFRPSTRQKGCDPRSESFLVQRLSLAIQRGNAASIMGTFAPGTTRCSYGETMTLCSQKWKDDHYTEKKCKGILMKERSDSNSNNNDGNHVVFENQEYNKADTDVESEDNNININISIRLHK